jgi:hypothetical protein
MRLFGMYNLNARCIHVLSGSVATSDAGKWSEPNLERRSSRVIEQVVWPGAPKRSCRRSE